MNVSQLNSPALLNPGQSLGRYQLIRRIAIGGMAELYLAKSSGIEGFEKFVALKRIMPHHATDSTLVSMFLDEAKLAARLQHPNIAQIYDVGLDAGTYFFTMEYVHGQDLREMTRLRRKLRKKLPIGNALSIVMGAARGLHHAHEAVDETGRPLNIVHRDVSGSNLVISVDGTTKLIDFGVSQSVDTAAVTQVGMFKGKVGYMSPEQCRGEAVDRRADIYGLGVILYELTTGTRLFGRSNDFSTLQRTIDGDLELPSQRVAGFPAALESIIIRCLAYNPVHRYATALELCRDLDEYATKTGVNTSEDSLSAYMRGLFAAKREYEGHDNALRHARAATVEGTPTNARRGVPRLDTWIVDSVDAVPSPGAIDSDYEIGERIKPPLSRKHRFARFSLGTAALALGVWLGVGVHNSGALTTTETVPTLSPVSDVEVLVARAVSRGKVVSPPATVLAEEKDFAETSAKEPRQSREKRKRRSRKTKKSAQKRRPAPSKTADAPTEKSLEPEGSESKELVPDSSEEKPTLEQYEIPKPRIRAEDRRATWERKSIRLPQ